MAFTGTSLVAFLWYDLLCVDAFNLQYQWGCGSRQWQRSRPLEYPNKNKITQDNQFQFQRDERTILSMVRNIDLPEALIFYGLSTIVDENGQQRIGLPEILQECAEIETAAVFLINNIEDLPAELPGASKASYHTQMLCIPPPNPADLLTATESITVQPRPFGGSAGFGSKAADPERVPLAQHCVVFTTLINQTRAARAAGMRVIAVGNDDDSLADAVIDSYEEIRGLDDIATPGSYWLNPPHPRDDEGNAVDPHWLATMATKDDEAATKGAVQGQPVNDEMDDDELQAILADMAPLQ